MLLEVADLQTHFFTPSGPVPAVAGVSFSLEKGRTLALVGESGCGKTVTVLSMLRLLPERDARIVGGRVLFGGRDLLQLEPRELRAIRGNRIAIVFQEPMSSLNPVLTVGQQAAEPLRIHRRMGRRAARQRVTELFGLVGLPQPQRCLDLYPHELSGGMRQRVMIAMALACEPELLIADEPTTALDVTIQAQILALLRDLRRRTGMAMIFITHDLAVVAEVADEVCVMYGGRVVERAPVDELFAAPRHPYTRGLLRCTPRLENVSPATGCEPSSPAARHQPLPVINGEIPDPACLPPGCPFHPRCEDGAEDAICQTQTPQLLDVAASRACACWKA
jgi:peptide/nickel transport system ATP-binding protein